jgi:hypothetical protein
MWSRRTFIDRVVLLDLLEGVFAAAGLISDN